MIFTVPVHVEEHKGFRVRALLFDGPTAERPTLQGATASFVHQLRKQMGDWAREHRQDALADLTFAPWIREERFTGTLQLRRGILRARFLVASFPALGRRVGLVPALGNLRFEVARGEAVLARAEEAVEAELRRREKEGAEGPPAGLAADRKGREFLETVELESTPRRNLVKEDPRSALFALLGGARVQGGAAELARVGRCLDAEAPDGLGEARHRAREVAELHEVLGAKRPDERRPVLLLGPPRAGKTALLHQVVRDRVADRDRLHASDRLTWLLSPQRLISGMSYVGQWEERLLAILTEARRRAHVLYVDDPVGLYHAGVSANSTLSVGQVLRPHVERGEVQLVVEANPETLRVLRETDRALADILHVIRVEPHDEETTLRVLLHLRRRLEREAGSERVVFEPDSLPAIVAMVRRFAPGKAFPGKAVELMESLAARYRGGEVRREQVLEHYQEATGMSLHLLDPRREFDVGAVEGGMARRVVGQVEARAAAVDAVAVARAGLEDPGRPLATFLFLGPTGVGKTQCARTLAATLYGSEERLLRFDMNQFVDAAAAARLVGTPREPEGLLTAALRRQPFSVVLLDEIEKAHPAVFDLLLQALGEGRLTDARGRTADLTRALFVMTSNLGVREAARTPGLVREEGAASGVFLKEAEDFFRPEFMNRIDRILPFASLARDDIVAVARHLVEDILDREGLSRRRTLLRVQPAALARAVDEGYDPALGARALARSLERVVAQGAAEHLAVLAEDDPAVVRVDVVGGALEVQVDALREAPARDLPTEALDLADLGRVAAGLKAAHARLGQALDSLLPGGELDVGNLDARAHEALQLKEELGSLRGRLETLERWAVRPPRRDRRVARPGVRARAAGRAEGRRRAVVASEALAALDARAYMEELAARAPPPGDDPAERAAFLARELALLDRKIADLAGEGAAATHRVELEGIGGAAGEVARLAGAMRAVYLALGLWVSDPEVDGEHAALEVRGAGADAILDLERGTHLLVDGEGRLRVVATRRPGDPGELPPVVRLHDARGGVVDFRTGEAFPGEGPDATDLRRVLVALLPLPPEVTP